MYLFKSELKVRSYECDIYGHVNNSVYLQYFETARVDFLDEIDLNLAKLKTLGFLLPIVRIEVDYFKPLYPGEIIEVTVNWLHRGRSSAVFEQEVIIKETGKVAAKGLVTWVSTDLKGHPIPIPEIILESAKRYFGELPPIEKKMIRKKQGM